ncbi:MAG: hypothetical protein WCI36_02435 [bacterium]
MFTKQDIIKSAVLIWIVVSIAYIGYDTWRDYQIRGIQQAYQAGIADGAKQLIEKSNAGQCKEPVTVSVGEGKIDFIDVKCLQQSGPQGQQQGPQGQAPTPTAPISTPKK